jgi:hypothetical protein
VLSRLLLETHRDVEEVALAEDEAEKGGDLMDFLSGGDAPATPVVEIDETPGPVDIPGVELPGPSEPWGPASPAVSEAMAGLAAVAREAQKPSGAVEVKARPPRKTVISLDEYPEDGSLPPTARPALPGGHALAEISAHVSELDPDLDSPDLDDGFPDDDGEPLPFVVESGSLAGSPVKRALDESLPGFLPDGSGQVQGAAQDSGGEPEPEGESPPELVTAPPSGGCVPEDASSEPVEPAVQDEVILEDLDDAPPSVAPGPLEDLDDESAAPVAAPPAVYAEPSPAAPAETSQDDPDASLVPVSAPVDPFAAVSPETQDTSGVSDAIAGPVHDAAPDEDLGFVFEEDFDAEPEEELGGPLEAAPAVAEALPEASRDAEPVEAVATPEASPAEAGSAPGASLSEAGSAPGAGPAEAGSAPEAPLSEAGSAPEAGPVEADSAPGAGPVEALAGGENPWPEGGALSAGPGESAADAADLEALAGVPDDVDLDALAATAEPLPSAAQAPAATPVSVVEEGPEAWGASPAELAVEPELAPEAVFEADREVAIQQAEEEAEGRPDLLEEGALDLGGSVAAEDLDLSAPAAGPAGDPEEILQMASAASEGLSGSDPSASLWTGPPAPSSRSPRRPGLDGDADGPAPAAGFQAAEASQSDFLESNSDYVGADTGYVEGTPGSGDLAPPFENRPAGSTLETPYSSLPGGGRSQPETSTAVIVNYLDDRDDGMFAQEAEEGELGADDDLDIDLLDVPPPPPFFAKPMTPVPKDPR